MPYTNVPEHLWGKMDDCVEKVQREGKDKPTAIAICHDSLVKGKENSAGQTDGLQLPEGVAVVDMLRTVEDSLSAELTAEEVQRIDQLYADVQAGRIALDELAAETDKAVANPRVPTGGTPTGTTPDGGSRGGATSGDAADKKRIRCYEHMRKLGVDDKTARQVCSRAFNASKAAACPATFTVNKQANGRYRWIMVTSSSFRDREGEIVSQKALDADTARMNASGAYGILDWWHTPIRLGSCDFSAMHGRLSIESGEYDDAFIGARFAEHQDEYAASRSFYHPLTEPDHEGVYHHIQTFRRAVLPRGREANVLTTHLVVREDKDMLQDKIKELIARLGGDTQAEQKVTELLAQADATEKAALDAGVAHKEEAPAAPVAPPTEPPKEAEQAAEAAMFVNDMKPDEFNAAVQKAIKEAVAPVLAESAAADQRVKALLAPIVAEIERMKADQAQALVVAVKEAGVAIAADIKRIADTQVALEARLAELEGMKPRAYRASQDPNTASKAKELGAPGPDEKAPYFASFVSAVVNGKPTPPA